MRAYKTSPALVPLAILGLLVLQPDVQARDTRHPVCSPVNDVQTVQGRNAPGVAVLHCGGERKVTQGSFGPHVTDILGRAGAAPARPAAHAPAVQAHGAGSREVEWVLGRAGGSPAKPPVFTPVLAAPTAP